jgi:UDP-glucose 4-epimerase
MRVLITGGFGFVGGRVAQHLQQAGHQIVLGTRKACLSPGWLHQAEVVTTDWHDGHALAQICYGVDVVIHAAGMNAQDCASDPVAALEFNALATARLVAAATRAGVKRFIYLSTAHVYASPLIGTITEDTCPRNLHPYATSHLAGENALLSASQRGEIEGIVLRLSNAFGAPVHKEVNCWMLLVNDLCRQAIQTRKMVLHSSGLQQRDFLAMEAVCRVVGYFSICPSNTAMPSVFNVGSGRAQTVLEMAKLIQGQCKAVFGFEPEIIRRESATNERHEMLTYRQERVKKLLENPIFEMNTEINCLLKFCQYSFNHVSS